MDPREIRKERRREQVREEILEATRAVLLDKGLSGLTLAAVARRVQLTKAALYYYFDSKEAIVFVLVQRSLDAFADVVEEALKRAKSGVEAIEALIRTSADYYATRKDELRLTYLVPQIGGTLTMSPESMRGVRPHNDRVYGTAAALIHKDQDAGRIPADVDGRRLAFLAHMAVLGMLTIEGLVEASDPDPLIHSHEGMVDELVQTFTARLTVK